MLATISRSRDYMKQKSESQKVLLKALHIYWKLYYIILLSRTFILMWFILVSYFELRNYESTGLWGTLVILLLITLTLALIARPYRTTGNLVISDERIFSEGQLVELRDCDKIQLCLSKPMDHSFFARFFAFYQHGFGSYIIAKANKQTQIQVNFLIEKKREIDELTTKLKKIELANNLELEITKFKQPNFPNWNSFLNKRNGL